MPPNLQNNSKLALTTKPLKQMQIHRFNTIALLVLLTVIFSCSDQPDEYAKPDIDFAYSIAYLGDSTYVEICTSNACNNLPANSKFKWIFNGSMNKFSFSGEYACDVYNKNGDFSISLVVTTPEDLQLSKSKDFKISGIKPK